MESHLLQMRGLKPVWKQVAGSLFVASFTDAWIETYRKEPNYGDLRRIFYRCVD